MIREPVLKADDPSLPFIKSVVNHPLLQGELIEINATESRHHYYVGHGLKRIPNGLFVVGANRGSWNVGFIQKDKTGAHLHLTPHWEQIDYYSPPANTTSFTFPETLNGDDDSAYKIEGHWVGFSGAAATLTLEPNAISANQDSTWSYTTSLGASAHSGTTSLVLARDSGNTVDDHFFTSVFRSTTGQERHMIGHDVMTMGSPPVGAIAGRSIFGVWDDQTTVITSLKVVCDQASGITTDAEFWLYRKPETAKVKVWIF